jgi:hypothetical protein
LHGGRRAAILGIGGQMTTNLKKMLGSGIFSISEAALYARVSPQLLSRWMFGTNSGDIVFPPQFQTNDKLLSFLDLVQAVAIREIRVQKKIPLVKFRQAIKTAKMMYKLDRPFAKKHVTYWTGGEIVIRPSDAVFVEASGKHAGQPQFQFVEYYLEKLEFDSSGMANLYRIFSHEGVDIKMNPKIRFGEPMLPSGYSAGAVWDAIDIEGGLDGARKACGIPLKEVQTAYRFYVDFLGKLAA